MRTRALTLVGAVVTAMAVVLASWDARIVDAHPRISTTLTWHADIAPLFERQCTSCHAAKTVSFPLTTYADVRPWVRAIREEVLERRMPPRRGWPGLEPGVDDHPLSPMERDLIVGWIDGGAPEGKPGAERTATFWCRMHPEVRDDRAGPCPVCGMALVPFLPDLSTRYGWTIEPAIDPKGRLLALRVSVTTRDTSSDAPTRISEFERVHEYPLHLFVVRDDFLAFEHVHPTPDGLGRFLFHWRRTPLSSGRYWLYGDFQPVGGPPQLLQRAIDVGSPPAPSGAVLPGLVAASEGVTATLTATPLTPTTANTSTAVPAGDVPRAGDVQRITIALKESRSGKPIADLEPYLGAWAHLFLVHEAHDEAQHAHPGTTGTTPKGPTIAFDVLFPRAGTYFLWAQVQRRHEIVTLPFRLHVVPRA